MPEERDITQGKVESEHALKLLKSKRKADRAASVCTLVITEEEMKPLVNYGCLMASVGGTRTQS